MGKVTPKGGDKTVKGSDTKQNYGTPDYLAWTLITACRLNWDACADKDNHKLSGYWTIEGDALAKDWTGKRMFINPQFNKAKQISAKAHYEWKKNGVTSVLLLPVNTTAKYYWDALADAQIFPIIGRVAFIDPDTKQVGRQFPYPMQVCIFSDEKFDIGIKRGNQNYLRLAEIEEEYNVKKIQGNLQ